MPPGETAESGQLRSLSPDEYNALAWDSRAKQPPPPALRRIAFPAPFLFSPCRLAHQPAGLFAQFVIYHLLERRTRSLRCSAVDA